MSSSNQPLVASMTGLSIEGSCGDPGKAHKSKRKNVGREYVLYQAAKDGCVSCVRRLIEEEGIDPMVKSATQQWTAFDFAR